MHDDHPASVAAGALAIHRAAEGVGGAGMSLVIEC
jgi:hypothetical protein